MPFDSNGTFNRVIPGGWQADAAAGTKITAIRHDAEDDGFATGLSTCITKDGRTQPLASIPMNNKNITALADPRDGFPQDAATKNYVDSARAFTTGMTISGAGPINGFLNFSAPTGVNGIGWTTADMSWIGRADEAGKWRKNLAVNSANNGTGGDVFSIDDAGMVNNTGYYSSYLVHDGVTWRTTTAGTGTLWFIGGGYVSAQTHDTATSVAYQPVTLRQFFQASSGGGNATLTLDASGSGKANQILSTNTNRIRWNMQMGNGAAETGGNAGSDWVLYAYDDAGGYLGPAMSVIRSTRIVYFGNGIGATTVHGDFAVEGDVTSSQNFQSYTTNVVLAASGGAVYLRPNGAASATCNWVIPAATGTLTAATGQNCGIMAGIGYKTHGPATSGGYGSNWYNINWTSPNVAVYIDNQFAGNITWQSDYRFKKDVQPLPTMWDKIKSLTPISYKIKKWTIFEEDDTPRWGFIAHELQEKLTESAASGHKDEKDVIQGPNLLALIAVLTKGLQEAMERIEVLEARAPA